MDSGRLEAVAAGTAHLDTVRALHQTVVSLRTALEVSKNELKELKQKYEQHSHCLEYTGIIEQLTLENHILRRKIIDSDSEDKEFRSQNIKLQVTYSPRKIAEDFNSEVVIHTATTESKSDINHSETEKGSEYCGIEQLSEIEEKSKSPNFSTSVQIPTHCDSTIVSDREEHKEYSSNRPEEYSQRGEEISPIREESTQLSPDNDRESEVEEPESQIASFARFDANDIPQSFKTRLELHSKFDVRIKVRTLKEGTVVSSTTSDSNSVTSEKRDNGKEKGDNDPFETSASFQFEEKREHFENKEDNKGNKIHLRAVSSENVKMAVPNEGDTKAKVDKFDVQVRITSEENLVVKEHTERNRRKDTLNLDVDDLSLRSLSEGDNSVFSEGGTTPMEPSASDYKQPESGNESEEVDDIELIFTTDESKDMTMNLQEDLVSIRETDNWAPTSASTHSTPVLIKFHTLDPDFQPGGGETTDNLEDGSQETAGVRTIAESSLRMKRVSLPSDKDIRHVAFNGKGSLELPGRGILKSCDNKSDSMVYKRSPTASARRLDSVDSLSCEYNRGLSFDNTKSSSFELGSSMDILHRDDSIDSFHKSAHLGHRFSVFAETDISKCGISEDDLSSNLNVRRNTCPNPFQYRGVQSRYVSRAPGPLKAGGGGRVRPVVREGAGGAGRRDSGAQTDVSALPPRWTSDGYLAYKMVGPLSGPTLPTRCHSRRPAAAAAAAPAPHPPPTRRTDETRRVMLSDIGFTSMVPELSRSADPVWALAKRPAAIDCEPPVSTSKFPSRLWASRSPCLCEDRSYEYIPHLLPCNVERRTRVSARAWRSSLPDVRHDDTDDLLQQAEQFVRRSIDNLYTLPAYDLDHSFVAQNCGQPYIPSEPRQLRLGHGVKLITPQGRVAVGRVRYVGLAGSTAANSSVVVGAELPTSLNPSLPRNDGTYQSRRYFLAASNCTAVFVPFSKVVMAWANYICN